MEARDYNPDITDYLGHGSLTVSHEYENNVFTTLLRNNLESGFKRGFAQAIWTFPIYKGLRGMVQISTGYGQSLIEYNHYNTSIGVGINLTDWLLHLFM